MALLQGEYIIGHREMQDLALTDLEGLVKSNLLRDFCERLCERDDFFETGDDFRGTVCKFRAYVFSEAELAEYKNRVIAEFMGYTGVFATRPITTQENN